MGRPAIRNDADRLWIDPPVARDGADAPADAPAVLVLQAHERPGPWVVRSLSGAGMRVVAGSPRALVGAAFAGASASSRRTPLPSQGTAAFVDAVRAIVVRDGIDVILPLSESTLLACVTGGDEEVARRTAGPTPGQYAALADKARLPELAACVGVATIPGTVVGGDEAADPLPAPPAIVKPLGSASAREGAVVYIRPVLARTVAERDAAVERVVATAGRALVQPYLEGDRLHVHAWRSRSSGGGLVTRVRRSWPPDIGMTSASAVVDDPQALDVALAILGAADYRGVASLDLIRTRGGVVVHDVNPRLPFSVAEALAGGLDMPRIAVEIALGAEPCTGPPAPAGVTYHWATGEIRWMGRGGGGQVARELAGAVVGRRRTVDPLSRGVALPGLLDLAGSGVSRMLRSRPGRRRAV